MIFNALDCCLFCRNVSEKDLSPPYQIRVASLKAVPQFLAPILDKIDASLEIRIIKSMRTPYSTCSHC